MTSLDIISYLKYKCLSSCSSNHEISKASLKYSIRGQQTNSHILQKNFFWNIREKQAGTSKEYFPSSPNPFRDSIHRVETLNPKLEKSKIVYLKVDLE